MSTGQYFDPGHGEYVMVDGQVVERDALHIAERIKEYDENLEVICIDPAHSDLNDAPFIICERRPDGSLNRIFECWTLDNTVLERIALADQYKFDASARLESLQSIQNKLKADRYKDKQEEMADILASAIKNRTSTFKVHNSEGELVKIHEDRPVERIERNYNIAPRTA